MTTIIQKLSSAGILFLAIFFGQGCSQKNEILVIDGEVDLLEAPYPMNYPSTAPKPNRVLKILNSQDVLILEERYEKDYLVYKVKTNNGEEGFVISKPNIYKKK